MVKRIGPLEHLARISTTWAGSSWAFGLAVLVVLIWLLTGPVFNFSDTWQLVINTGTTVITFLMVFLIQRTQNKDAGALHLKLNELIAAVKGASDRLINIEDLSEKDIEVLHRRYHRLVKLVKANGDLTGAHSVEEAPKHHGAHSPHNRENNVPAAPEA